MQEDRIEQDALELLQAIREHHPHIYAGAWVGLTSDSRSASLSGDSEASRGVSRGRSTRAGRLRSCTACMGIFQPRPLPSSGETPSSSPARSIWRMRPGVSLRIRAS